MKPLGERLYELRTERDLSQDEVAERVGVSRQAVSNWERGETKPDTENLIALARMYGMSLDDLVQSTDPSDSSAQNTRGDKSGRRQPHNLKRNVGLALIIVAIAAVSATVGIQLYRQRSESSLLYINGTVVATAPIWNQYVIQDDIQWEGHDERVFYTIVIDDETVFMDANNHVIDPEILQEGWQVSAMFPESKSDANADRIPVQEVTIRSKD